MEAQLQIWEEIKASPKKTRRISFPCVNCGNRVYYQRGNQPEKGTPVICHRCNKQEAKGLKMVLYKMPLVYPFIWGYPELVVLYDEHGFPRGY